MQAEGTFAVEEGWAHPFVERNAGQTFFHYFRGGTLCSRWKSRRMMFLAQDPTEAAKPHTHPPTAYCSMCWRLRMKERGKRSL